MASHRVTRSLCIHAQKVLIKVCDTQWHLINTKRSMLLCVSGPESRQVEKEGNQSLIN